MTPRHIVFMLLVVALGLFLLSCAGPTTLSSIQITPPAASVGPAGSHVQFTATATYTQGRHPPTTKDVTNEVTWASSNTDVATVNSAGLATAGDAGSASITATLEGSSGPVSGNASMDVTSGVRSLTSIAIFPIPGSQTVYALGETAQFLAIGTFSSSPTTQDVTDSVTWKSVDVDVATINSSGLATAVSCAGSPPCLTNITASTTLGNGTTVIATSNLSVFPNSNQSNLPSLTVYPVGSGTGTVVSDPVGINCGSGTGCTADFVLNSTVTLTATATTGSSTVILGFSANCQPDTAPPGATTATCQVIMGGNQTVGVIFNTP